MTGVGVHEAKTHFSKLLRRVEAGEEVVILRDGEPVARLVPLESKPPIRFGGLEGRIDLTRFDEADEEIERQFYGEDATPPS